MKNTVTVNSFPGNNMDGLKGFCLDGETDRHTIILYPQTFSDPNHRIDMILRTLCNTYTPILRSFLGLTLTFL